MKTLEKALAAAAEPIFAQREERFRGINTPEKVKALQQEVRTVARDSFGAYTCGLDATNTPPKVLKSGEVKLDGVVVEKLLVEAFDNFWVSAVLYRPAKAAAGAKRPAMVMPVGHWWAGKNNEMYQRMMRLMARRGVVCVSFDDCGQGERVEHFSPVVRDNMQYLADIHPKDAPIPYPLSDAPRHGFLLSNNVTSSHSLIGEPGYLCGVHLNTLTAIAGKRIVDYLISRKDIDGEKIGAMGASGGGADTRFLLAYDPRIALAVPTSILSGNRSITGGDADQCFFFTMSRGFSQIDLLILQAPKPLLIISSSEDNHDSAGVAAFYRPFWKAFGKETEIASGTGQGAHGFPQESRKIIAEFILKHFLNDTRPVLDSEHPDDEPLCSEFDLQTTFMGNVAFDAGATRAIDLARERALALGKSRQPQTGAALRQTVLKVLRETEESMQRPAANVKSSPAEIVWETEGEVGLRVRFTAPAPAASTGRLLVYAHDRGAETPGRPLLRPTLAQSGLAVAELEVRGTGISREPGAENKNAMLCPMISSKQVHATRIAYTMGRSLVGMRVADFLQAARVLKATLPTGTAIDLVAEHGLGFAATLAAFLEPEAFRRVILFRAPIHWTELAVNEERAYPFSDYLHGVLEHFDLPDITRALMPGKLAWVNPTDSGMRAISMAAAKRAHRGAPVEFKQVRVPAELLRVLKK